MTERKVMIKSLQSLPVTRQCQILDLARSTAYYTPVPVSERDLLVMRTMDKFHLDYPFAGSRTLCDWLNRDGFAVGREHVRTLMRRMGIHAIYCRPRTSQSHPAHTIYPYLLRSLDINRPNQVWATDITYLPMKRGFVYLVAVIDWYSRKVLSWRLSNTLTTDFCIEAVEEAIDQYGTPDIFNTDQGSQFTSIEFTGLLQQHSIRISMDGKGRWVDNVLIERLWRSVKYEEVYLHAYDSVAEAQAGLKKYFQFYNTFRTHQSLDRQTPDTVYFTQAAALRSAA